MDFVIGLPRTRKLLYSIWLIIDSMTMSSHFIHMKSTYRAKDYDKLYVDEIVMWYGIHLSIICDKRDQFTSHICRSFKKILGI